MHGFRSLDSAQVVRRRTRVALFGYYNQGNFGDDLMAVMTARYLLDAGYKVRVYGLTDQDAEDFGLERTTDIADLLENADAVVVGGGGLLCKRSWSSPSAAYQNLIATILDHCQRTTTPVMGISLGGSGHSTLDEWQAPSLRLIRDAAFCTFRNPEDLDIARLCGRPEFTWHLDLVWLTSRFFPQSVPARARPTVVVNVVQAKYGRRVRPLLTWTLDRQSAADVYYVDTSNANVTSHKVTGYISQKAAMLSTRRRKFSRMQQDLPFLANVDMVITNRLHSGMAAMSYGASMISFFGYGKTRLALKHVGRSTNHISHRNCLSFLSRIGDYDKWGPAYPALSAEEIISIQDDAMKHLSELVAALDRIALKTNGEVAAASNAGHCRT